MYIVEKNGIKIQFDNKGSIESLLYREKEFIGKKLPLFHLRLRKNEKTADVYSIDASQIDIKMQEDELSFSFSSFNAYEMRVLVHATIKDNISWRISLENNTDYFVEWIGFPELATPEDLIAQKGKARVLYGSNEGGISENVRIHKYIEPDYPSEGLMGIYPAVVETQFLAYYEKDGAGLYMGAHDKEGNLKAIDFHLLDDSFIKFHFRLYAAVRPKTSYHMNYDMVWQFFCGDWQDAADIYRDWFEINRPDDFKKIEEDDSLPQWYKDSFVVVTYPVRGIFDTDVIVPNKLYPYKNAMPHIKRISEALDSQLLVLLMHWEGTAPWAPPYVWPPFGGEEEFINFIDEVHSEGHVFGVYCSGTGFTMQSNLMEYGENERFNEQGLGKYMCTAPDGSLPDSHICQAQRRGYDMCISQKFTKDTLFNESMKMVNAGIDYIQLLDQNHGGTPYFCYSTEHGHPPVPGLWQVNEMKDFLQNVVKSAKEATGKDIVFGCESAAAESYIPYLRLSDNRFNLNYFGAWPVPVYAYVFHEYVNNFSGNGVCGEWICDRKKSPEVLLMRLAHSFIAGDLFTLVITENGDIAWNWGIKDSYDLPNQENIFKFVKDANRLRKREKKYLCFGKMIKGAKVQCETYPFYSYSYLEPIDIPTLMGSTWKASDGTIATVIANYLDKPNHFSMDLSNYGGGKLFDAIGNLLIEVNDILEAEIQPLTAYIVKYNK